MENMVKMGRLYTNGKDVVHVIKRFSFPPLSKISYIHVPGYVSMVDEEDNFLKLYPTLVERIEIVEQ